MFVTYSSVGETEVTEGIRAVAARHRGESTLIEYSVARTCTFEHQWVPLGLFWQQTSIIPDLFVFQEEYEDSSGNVVNKKTYEDLKRQGLL